MSKLKEILDMRGITQAELVRRTGITQRQISYFLAGESDITLKKAKKIADAIGVKIDDFA